MIKTILKLLVEVLGKKLIKAGLEETLLKNKTYIDAAKQVWNVVEENFRITELIEEKISSKADAFDKMLISKFPELTQNDVVELRQAVAGEINSGKEAVLNEASILKQQQDTIAKLTAENANLKDQLSQVKSLFGINTVQEAATTTNTVSQSE
jgi:hypothetical protein